MAALKKLLIAVVVLVVLLMGIGMLLPGDYKVKRDIIIEVPAHEVYPLIVDLEQWPRWGVWFNRDPDMVVEYSGPDAEVGMTSSWQSETEGNGEMTIIATEPARRVVYELRFPEMDMTSTGELVLSATPDGTKVVWMDYGNVGLNPVNRYFGLMMDSLIGPDFENGLANLKKVAENTKSS